MSATKSIVTLNLEHWFWWSENHKLPLLTMVTMHAHGVYTYESYKYSLKLKENSFQDSECICIRELEKFSSVRKLYVRDTLGCNWVMGLWEKVWVFVNTVYIFLFSKRSAAARRRRHIWPNSVINLCVLLFRVLLLSRIWQRGNFA
jgi:hypothetical protein